MAEDSEFDAMTDACIEAGECVMQTGSPALQAAMRVVLTILGREIVVRSLAPWPDHANGADSVDSAG